ncbi:MAG: hypothetical protein R3D00_10940 [Bacteroidia bacterium]
MALFEDMIRPDMLESAWVQVKGAGKAGGVDRVSVESFEQNAAVFLVQLHQELQEETYVPEPYLEVKIPKDDGEFRINCTNAL